jgi:hypothetical protein
MQKLENELLTAAADHINDKLYYTYAPLHLEVKPDYFTEGVKMLVSFDKFDDKESGEAEMNVTMPAFKVPIEIAHPDPEPSIIRHIVARFTLNGREFEKTIELPTNGRFTVGRTGSNGLVLDDISVSKVHASIAVSDSGLAVADTGSTNGTFINDKRIAYGKAVPFGQKDSIKFGTVGVTFEVSEPKATDGDAETGDGSVQVGEFEFTSRMQESESVDEAPKNAGSLDEPPTTPEPEAAE